MSDAPKTLTPREAAHVVLLREHVDPALADMPRALAEWSRRNAPPPPAPPPPHPRHPGRLYWREVDEGRCVGTTLPNEPEADARASGYLAKLFLTESGRWTARLTLREELVFFAVGGATNDVVRALCQDAMARERECELAGMHDPQIAEHAP